MGQPRMDECLNALGGRPETSTLTLDASDCRRVFQLRHLVPNENIMIITGE